MHQGRGTKQVEEKVQKRVHERYRRGTGKGTGKCIGKDIGKGTEKGEGKGTGKDGRVYVWQRLERRSTPSKPKRTAVLIPSCSPGNHEHEDHRDGETPAPLTGVELVDAETDGCEAVRLGDHAQRLGGNLRCCLRQRRSDNKSITTKKHVPQPNRVPWRLSS